MLIRLRNTFFAGIAVLLPAFITFTVIKFLIVAINSRVLNPFISLLTPYLAGPYRIYAAKFGIFVLFFFTICVIGWAANIIVIRKFFGIWENIFVKVPMVGKIYTAVKQISSAFLGHGKTIFKKVVLIEYPRKGLYSIGFVTGKGEGEIPTVAGSELSSVFVPTTPNPTSGIFLLAPKNELKFLRMSVEEGMKLVISGGAVIPPFKPER